MQQKQFPCDVQARIVAFAVAVQKEGAGLVRCHLWPTFWAPADLKKNLSEDED